MPTQLAACCLLALMLMIGLNFNLQLLCRGVAVRRVESKATLILLNKLHLTHCDAGYGNACSGHLSADGTPQVKSAAKGL